MSSAAETLEALLTPFSRADIISFNNRQQSERADQPHLPSLWKTPFKYMPTV
jgi:hypothetical protein